MQNKTAPSPQSTNVGISTFVKHLIIIICLCATVYNQQVGRKPHETKMPQSTQRSHTPTRSVKKTEGSYHQNPQDEMLIQGTPHGTDLPRMRHETSGRPSRGNTKTSDNNARFGEYAAAWLERRAADTDPIRQLHDAGRNAPAPFTPTRNSLAK